MRRFPRLAVLFFIFSISRAIPQAIGQSAPPRGPGDALSRALGNNPAPPADAQGRLPLSEEIDPTGGPPYRTPEGRYVVPDPNSPDDWSQRGRLYPDYSQFQHRDGSQRRIPTDRFGRNDQGPAYNGYGYYDGGGQALGDAYIQGRYDARHDYLWHIASQRAGRLLNQYAQVFDDGLDDFHEGRYDRAAIALIGAAEKNQASAAARLHAGHALFALGRYEDSIRLIARAFELSPSLAFKNYDIRDEYGHREDFDRQAAALRARVAAHPNDASAQALLGYVTFFSGNPGGAYPALARAAKLSPTSYFIPKLLDLARMTQAAASVNSNPMHDDAAVRPVPRQTSPSSSSTARPTVRRTSPNRTKPKAPASAQPGEPESKIRRVVYRS